MRVPEWVNRPEASPVAKLGRLNQWFDAELGDLRILHRTYRDSRDMHVVSATISGILFPPAGIVLVSYAILAQAVANRGFDNKRAELVAMYEVWLDQLVKENPELRQYLRGAATEMLKTEASRRKYSGGPS